MARKQNWAWIAVGAACLWGFGGFATARADDAAPAGKTDATRSQPSPAEIQQWVKDLDSDTYAARQTAAEMLVQTGKPAIDAVAEAASGKSLEVTMQAVNILRRLSQSADQATRDPAKDALERLAKSDSAAAAPAKEALATPPAPAVLPGNIRAFGRLGGGIQIVPGGQIQIVPGGIPAGGVQVFRIQANAIGGKGNRSIDVNENGKQTHITEDQNGIEVKVTEKVNGQDKTDTYKAKDATELKNKFPEAAKLYDKYMNGQGIGNIQIQAQALPLQLGGIQVGGVPGAFMPLGLGPQQVVPNTDATKQAAQQIAEAQKRIAEATENLRKNPGAPPSAEDMKRALDQLDEARKQLEEARGKLGS